MNFYRFAKNVVCSISTLLYKEMTKMYIRLYYTNPAICTYPIVPLDRRQLSRSIRILASDIGVGNWVEAGPIRILASDIGMIGVGNWVEVSVYWPLISESATESKYPYIDLWYRSRQLSRSIRILTSDIGVGNWVEVPVYWPLISESATESKYPYIDLWYRRRQLSRSTRISLWSRCTMGYG